MPEKLGEDHKFSSPSQHCWSHPHIADNDKYVDAVEVLYLRGDA
jgi:hypothetical protein